jgi:hypothetical protein
MVESNEDEGYRRSSSDCKKEQVSSEKTGKQERWEEGKECMAMIELGEDNGEYL